jgi:MFS family permease
VESKNLLFPLLVILLTVGAVGGAFVNVSFLSWVGDLVPLGIRGRFFGHRSMVATAAALLSGLLVGKVLDAVRGVSGFTFVFGLASLAGLTELSFFCQGLRSSHECFEFGNQSSVGPEGSSGLSAVLEIPFFF